MYERRDMGGGNPSQRRVQKHQDQDQFFVCSFRCYRESSTMEISTDGERVVDSKKRKKLLWGPKCKRRRQENSIESSGVCGECVSVPSPRRI